MIVARGRTIESKLFSKIESMLIDTIYLLYAQNPPGSTQAPLITRLYKEQCHCLRHSFVNSLSAMWYRGVLPAVLSQGPECTFGPIDDKQGSPRAPCW
jgi:hypothetical protein